MIQLGKTAANSLDRNNAVNIAEVTFVTIYCSKKLYNITECFSLQFTVMSYMPVRNISELNLSMHH